MRDGHCASLGRDYNEIEKTTLNVMHITRDGRNNTLTPSAAIDIFVQQANIGIDQAIFSMPNVNELEPFDLLANEIVPVVERIVVAGR